MTSPPRASRQIKVNALTQAQLIKLLLEGTYTCAELAEMTGLHYVTVLEYCRELHLAGAAYIASWNKDALGRDSLKVYKLGSGRDAKRAALTPSQRAQRAREKRRNAQLALVLAGRGRMVQAANGRLRFEPTTLTY